MKKTRMSTKFNDLIPILICEDVQKSIDFYCRVLGFEVTDRMDDVGKTGWASLQNRRVQLMLGSPAYLPEPKKTDGKYPQKNDPSQKLKLHLHQSQ